VGRGEAKGAVGIGAGRLHQEVQTYSDMLTRWIRRCPYDRRPLPSRTTSLDTHHLYSRYLYLWRTACRGGWGRGGDGMAGELRIARCTPFRPLRSTTPAHMVEQERIWRRSDVRAMG
jgi:hypothetical protein